MQGQYAEGNISRLYRDSQVIVKYGNAYQMFILTGYMQPNCV